MLTVKNVFRILFLIGISLFLSCDGDNEPLDPALINQFVVDDNCAIPTELETTSINGGTTINLSWTSTTATTGWQVEYGLTNSYVVGDGTKLDATTTTININNLFATNSYTFSVRSKCGDGFSEWSAPVNVVGVNLNCANPTGVTASRSTTNSAEVSVNWIAPTTQTAWEISYGATGFNVNQGTNIVQATSKPKLITGLATTAYDFYVRAKCSATETSNWVGPIAVAAVTSQGTGIVGNYLLTAFTSSTPTDINADGTSNTNILSETACYNNMFIKLLASNTFTQDDKGADIEINIVNNVSVTTIECFVDPIVSGTWAVNGSILTLTYTGGETQNLNYNAATNVLSTTINDGAIVGTTSQGGPITLTTDLTFTFTKQ
jgi:Fibronectin type III domain